MPSVLDSLPFGLTRRGFILGTTFVLGCMGLVGVTLLGEVRLALTAVVIFMLITLGMINVRLSILGLFVYLTVLGDVRRLLVPLVGWSGADPLLMIAPAFGILLTAYALVSRRVSTSSALSKWMLVFTGIMMLQIFNPKQGGLTVGVAGALLVIVPTFWFWIGQAYGSKDFARKLLFYVVVPLSVLAIGMGFIQLVSGYLPYQLEWYRIAGYKGLGDSEETLRPISIFPNITEYLVYVSIAVVVLFATLLHKDASTRLKQVAILVIPIGLLALVLAGSRGPVIMSVFVIVLMWAVQGRTVASWMPRLAIAGVLGAVGFVWSLQQVGTIGGSERVQANLQRQAELVETGGTASIHAELAWGAVRHGVFKEPLGMGIGSITLAASKFGGAGYNSEKDITNMFIATGAGGGVVYLIVVGLVTMAAIRYWIRTRTLIALALFAFLAVTGLTWLHPGHYVTTPLAWLVIGILDRLDSDTEAVSESKSIGQASAQSTPA